MNTRARSCEPFGRYLLLAFVVATSLALTPTSAFAQRHNASTKWGATFYYWDPYTLPSYSAPPDQSPWGPGSQTWWDTVVARASYAGFGWLAANSWGYGSNADPASLGGLVTAITNSGTNMKVALFDDTTSEVLRKNLAKHGCWALPGAGSGCAGSP